MVAGKVRLISGMRMVGINLKLTTPSFSDTLKAVRPSLRSSKEVL